MLTLIPGPLIHVTVDSADPANIEWQYATDADGPFNGVDESGWGDQDYNPINGAGFYRAFGSDEDGNRLTENSNVVEVP